LEFLLNISVVIVERVFSCVGYCLILAISGRRRGLTKILHLSRRGLTLPLARPGIDRFSAVERRGESLPQSLRRVCERIQLKGRSNMTWTAPEACEVCVGMEVTSYMSAEI
jgi:coenzyme PQQ precursor peptide PqqA